MLRSLPWRYKLPVALAPAALALLPLVVGRRGGHWQDLPSGLLAYCVAATLASLLLFLLWRTLAVRYFRRHREADDRMALLALCTNMQHKMLLGYAALTGCVAAAHVLLTLAA
ncbi:MAG TPA: hypothetical protein VEA40_01050 [Ramlibacter sp.]|nr:hypothetical protein [Ramlibacter sp.]